MIPGHPLELVPLGRRRAVFMALLVATLLCTAALSAVDRPLRTAASPNGIVSFELAGSVPHARSILASWDARARTFAAFSLGLDFLYLVLYSTTLAFACLWAGRVLAPRAGGLGRLGRALAWGQWAAGLFDFVEDIALWRVLSGPLHSPWPELAWGCAVPKFALVGFGLVFAALGALAVLAGRGD